MAEAASRVRPRRGRSSQGRRIPGDFAKSEPNVSINKGLKQHLYTVIIIAIIVLGVIEGTILFFHSKIKQIVFVFEK